MKNQISLLIIGCAMLVACENKQIEADKSKLVGEWGLVESYGYAGKSLIEAWQKQPSYYGYVFREDNRFFYNYIHTANIALPIGTYSVAGSNQINVTISGSTRAYKYSFDGGTLILSDLAPKTSNFWKYKLVR